MTNDVSAAPAVGEVVRADTASMKCSTQINEIVAALAKAQGTINNPGKKATNPHYKSQYADLSMGLNAIREGLSANGLAVIQSTRMWDNVLMLDTRLAHSSGQWFEAEYPVCTLPGQPQIIGSALTYARRYSLFGLVGIAGEDDDGNAAKDAKVEVDERISSDQFQDLSDLMAQTLTPMEAFCSFYKVSALADLPASRFKEASDFLNLKLRRATKP
jgi:hypothetical protein